MRLAPGRVWLYVNIHTTLWSVTHLMCRLSNVTCRYPTRSCLDVCRSCGVPCTHLSRSWTRGCRTYWWDWSNYPNGRSCKYLGVFLRSLTNHGDNENNIIKLESYSFYRKGYCSGVSVAFVPKRGLIHLVARWCEPTNDNLKEIFLTFMLEHVWSLCYMQNWMYNSCSVSRELKGTVFTDPMATYDLWARFLNVVTPLRRNLDLTISLLQRLFLWFLRIVDQSK